MSAAPFAPGAVPDLTLYAYLARSSVYVLAAFAVAERAGGSTLLTHRDLEAALAKLAPTFRASADRRQLERVWVRRAVDDGLLNREGGSGRKPGGDWERSRFKLTARGRLLAHLPATPALRTASDDAASDGGAASTS